MTAASGSTKGIAAAAMSARVELTTRAFVRSHSAQPRGHGMWIVQRSLRETAFAADLFGEQIAIIGTLTEVRAELRRRGVGGLWAVLP